MTNEPRGPTHGGKRAGAGRKAGPAYGTKAGGRPRLGDKPSAQLTTRLAHALLADVKAWAKRAGCTVNRAVNTLLAKALED